MAPGREARSILPARAPACDAHHSRWRCAAPAWLLIALFVAAPAGAAAGISIQLQGADRHPVAGVVATATPLGMAAHARERRTAVMDQVNKAFVPQVLVISAGTSVEFPNNDSVSHQVYSFSAAKRFQLPLYKGEVHSPISFDRPGLVVLGCNIHDSMVGYIYVTDTPYFGSTDGAGRVQFADLPAGRYRLQLWSPMIADDARLLGREVELREGETLRVEFQLGKPLRRLPEPRPHPDGWDAY